MNLYLLGNFQVNFGQRGVAGRQGWGWEGCIPQSSVKNTIILKFLIFLFLGEAARIQQCKGRVFSLQDEPEVARVWLPNNDSPGLAMARAFGDFCLKDFGLISVPDIYYRHLTKRDEFIILATDGVSLCSLIMPATFSSEI